MEPSTAPAPRRASAKLIAGPALYARCAQRRWYPVGVDIVVEGFDSLVVGVVVGISGGFGVRCGYEKKDRDIG